MSDIAETATIEDARKTLLALFHCYHLSGSPNDISAKFHSYWYVLRSLPPACLISACRDAMHGRLGAKQYLPPASIIYDRAVSYIPVPRIEPLPISDIKPEAAEEVRVGLNRLRDEIRGVPFDAVIAATPVTGEGVVISPGLRKVLKMQGWPFHEDNGANDG